MQETRRRSLSWGDGFEWLLILLVLVGVAYRFIGIDWSQGANLHPDEYGLTNTLTQLKLPTKLADYFNTRVSPLSPYVKYDLNGVKTVDGPDNRMRWGQWPLILLRAAAEWTQQTGYDELRLTGRQLSAFVDSLSLIMLFLIGARLFGRRVGLLAAALSGLAALQIQQAHFMTVDTFATFFAMLAMYAAVRIAQGAVVRRPTPPPAPPLEGEGRIHKWGVFAPTGGKNSPYLLSGVKSQDDSFTPYQPAWGMMGWFVVFGVAFGMALASKINLAPLAVMVVVAAMISVADIKLRMRSDLWNIFAVTALFLVISGLAAVVTFRLTQPMSIRATKGDTTLLTLQLNPDWMDSMAVAQGESSGTGVGPPGDQWASRTTLVYPLINMVFWGMGLPLGVAAWAAFLAALGQWLIFGRGWRAHLLPLIWTGGYFLFMGTRWVMSVRYFLPIYPFLCLFAAWGLVALWRRMRTPGWKFAAGLVVVLVLGGTLAWATAFSSAVYWTDHTRLQASRWIYENVPGPVQLTMTAADGRESGVPLGLTDGMRVAEGTTVLLPFRAAAAGKLTGVILPHTAGLGGPARLHLSLKNDPADLKALDEVELAVPAEAGGAGNRLLAAMAGVPLEKERIYYLAISVPAGPTVQISRTVISDESWDETLPVSLDGHDPFGQLYRGIIMQVRWLDDEAKRQMFVDTLAQVDYIFVPSQRAVWATCRLPKTYPMTMAYYRALFAGELGFELAADFSAPLRLGPLYVSDLAGSAAWGKPPALPVLNHNPLAAEEAFSVYDHPPVWIFRKTAAFDLAAVQRVFDSIDLSLVVNESPLKVSSPPCQ